MRLLVIGAGNMGLTYAKGINRVPGMVEGKIMLLESDLDRVDALNAEGVFDAYTSPQACVAQADVILLAVKPQQCVDLFKHMAKYTNAKQLFISIMAGVKIATMEKYLDAQLIARAMPNLPAQIGQGMTGFTVTNAMSTDQVQTVQDILGTTGKVVRVPSEEAIDKITGVSGSGPAYVFYFIQHMMKAACDLGFSPEDAKTLVGQTFAGATALFMQDDASAQEWINRVASKGGTTRAALDVMDNAKLGADVEKAVWAAFNRAVELGNS